MSSVNAASRGSLDSFEQVAAVAVAEAMAIARARFSSDIDVRLKNKHGELVTEVDLECESRIISTISSQFPDHSIASEERPIQVTGSDWTWVIDPLDGTNNYAAGIALYGVSVALLHRDRCVMAVCAEGPNGPVMVAREGEGVGSRYGLSVVSRIQAAAEIPERGTVSSQPHNAALWLGYDVASQSDRVQMARTRLWGDYRRVYENWSPIVDVGLFLRGELELLVALSCSGSELPAAMLMLREAGAIVESLDDRNGTLSPLSDPVSFVAGTNADAVGETSIALR